MNEMANVRVRRSHSAGGGQSGGRGFGELRLRPFLVRIPSRVAEFRDRNLCRRSCAVVFALSNLEVEGRGCRAQGVFGESEVQTHRAWLRVVSCRVAQGIWDGARERNTWLLFVFWLVFAFASGGQLEKPCAVIVGDVVPLPLRAAIGDTTPLRVACNDQNREEECDRERELRLADWRREANVEVHVGATRAADDAFAIALCMSQV